MCLLVRCTSSRFGMRRCREQREDCTLIELGLYIVGKLYYSGERQRYLKGKELDVT